MKKNLFVLVAALCVIANAKAQTYVCSDNGKPIYTTVKLNDQCTPSKLDEAGGASVPVKLAASDVALPQASETAQSVPQIIEDEISKVWTKSDLSALDDTIILPAAPKVDSSGATNIKTKVRNALRRAAPVVAAPVTRPPQLTRRQLLQQEISREKAAMARAQASLNAARSKNDNENIRRFDAQVRDRELNIRALEQEMRR